MPQENHTCHLPRMQTEYIASGDYYIAVAETKLLKVLLGSCVGVAIFDKTANIGGIIHLLLPEPASFDSSWAPASYATSGLPLFINTILRLGANKEHLQAVLAGGALFGHISKQDIAMNIGGRCIDKVHAILEERQIPIVAEESCGVTASVLTLDTSCWRHEIVTRFGTHPIDVTPMPPASLEIASAIQTITPIPQAALKIINLISWGDYETSEIARTIETDQVLAAKVLQLCNSPLVALKRPVDSIDEAVMLLGGSRMLEMVATASINPLLADRHEGYALLRGGLYKHAVGVAHIAQVIARDTALVPTGVAYAAGLLHDIGKVVLDQYFSLFKPLFYQAHQHSNHDMIMLEQQFLGTDHQKTGQRLAAEWGLPDSLSQVIAHHHQPEEARAHQELAHIIHVADMLAAWYLAGLELERMNSATLRNRLAFLGLSPDRLPSLIEKVPWKSVMYL